MTEQLAFDPSETEVDTSRVLFIGRGKGAVGWYRCYLPAMFMAADWVGVSGTPPKFHLETGLVKRRTALPKLTEYDIIVVSQPKGIEWLRLIRWLQERGIKVLYEIDDYLHGIKNMKDHDFAQHYTKKDMAAFEQCMKVCDGLIASTPYIARRYQKFSKKTWVCKNAIDVGRYNLTLPPRPTVNIGWAGATGHQRAIAPWITEVANVMVQKENTCFVSIGQAWAQRLEPHFPGRCIATPFTSLETYPAAMTMFDIALAPAGKGNFFLGKSDLRWLEASALGIPVIADPVVYPEIEDERTGFHAESPSEVRDLLLELVENRNLRTEVGERAREYVRRERHMGKAVRQWINVFEEVLDVRSEGEGREGDVPGVQAGHSRPSV